MGRTNVRFWERGEKSPGRRGFFVFSGRSNSGLVKRSLPTMGGRGVCAALGSLPGRSPRQVYRELNAACRMYSHRSAMDSEQAPRLP